MNKNTCAICLNKVWGSCCRIFLISMHDTSLITSPKGQVLVGSEEYGALAGADDRCVDVLAEIFDAQEED